MATHCDDIMHPSTSSATALRSFSIVDLFTIGIGPSSSHTVGPMRAARVFADEAAARGTPSALTCELFGSLALTGRGHATDIAVLLGLSGWRPEDIDPDGIGAIVDTIRATGRLNLAGKLQIPFNLENDLVFRKGEFLKDHSNTMRFTARYADGATFSKVYMSIGGGAISAREEVAAPVNVAVPYRFNSAAELLSLGHDASLSISDIMWANEASWRPREETTAFLDAVRVAMLKCIERGCQKEGILPGGLKVVRRAKHLYENLLARGPRTDPSNVFEWVSLYALAVNEENAAGGRVVTAPTNGAAGVLPAVLKYYEVFIPGSTREGSHQLLMTASAIGFLYKARASISAAEMGCQGEVGVACSMAAAGLAAALGGSNAQVENAAEIGMEHNLGLTCDPIKGLVQVPCIERNTMGAVKAINAAYLAMQGDGRHIVPLDAVIETMRQTGDDMRTKYKETALGGLAVNVVEC
jgi:L-serine dehydratase